MRVVHDNAFFVNPSPRAAWEIGDFHLVAECRSANGPQGGDFYAFRLQAPKRLAVVIGDACGRGSDAAALLPLVLARLEELSFSPTPARFLSALNELLVGELSTDRFVTSAAFVIDGQARTVMAANAGHVPALLRRASGEVLIVGQPSGPPLGIMKNPTYADETFHFDAGDVMVLMTDGVLEAVETDLARMPTLTSLIAEGTGTGLAVHGRLLSQLAAEPARRAPDDMMLLCLELLSKLGSTSSAGLPRTV